MILSHSAFPIEISTTNEFYFGRANIFAPVLFGPFDIHKKHVD